MIQADLQSTSLATPPWALWTQRWSLKHLHSAKLVKLWWRELKSKPLLSFGPSDVTMWKKGRPFAWSVHCRVKNSLPGGSHFDKCSSIDEIPFNALSAILWMITQNTKLFFPSTGCSGNQFFGLSAVVSKFAAEVDCHTQNLHHPIFTVAPAFQEFGIHGNPVFDRTILAPFQIESKVLDGKN